MFTAIIKNSSKTIEDETFLKIFKKELKSKNDIVESKDKLLDYINNNY